MSWTDLKSLEQIKKLRDRFDIKVYVETGTFRGQGTTVNSGIFDTVLTVEINREYYLNAKCRMLNLTNVYQTLASSPDYLRSISPALKTAGTVMFFLDAHFYDATLPLEDRLIVMQELKALEGFGNCVIVIHDFNCNGLGGLCYDGQLLNFDLVKDTIAKVNPNFHYYFNEFSGCEIVTKKDITDGKLPGLILDKEMEDTIDWVWSAKPQTFRSHRGILYATPEPLDLTQFELVETH
jgi:hypothetical protein